MARSYPPEFRRKVLNLLDAGRNVTEIAFNLDVTAAKPASDRHRPTRGHRLGAGVDDDCCVPVQGIKHRGGFGVRIELPEHA